MRRILLSIAIILIANSMQAQDLTVKLWDNASAPHSNSLSGAEKDEGLERISNVSEAALYIYEADAEKATGQAVVICPGGGYALLSMGHEGRDFARWFAAQGITAVVLKYRMPNHTPQVPMEDAAEAVRYMREEYAHKDKLHSVGIMGFSAGGHLAASTSAGALEANGDKSPRATARPDFTILFYPVITGDAAHGHKGSYDNLLGAERTQEQTNKWSPELLVGQTTPPAFLVLSDDDVVKPINSTRYYNALKQFNTPASLHILPSGGHGWGFRDFKYKKAWQEALSDWLQGLNRK
ncbi:MAG: alpha/beta hydrolase [Alistipes sp.]|nr:alpha/beta hydrolase [Alistipes sp.]